MPALPAVSKVFRLDFNQTYGGNTRIKDRLFFSYTGAISAADAATLATTARNAWNTNLAPILVNTHSLTSIQLTDLNSNTGVQVVNSTAAPGTAAVAGVPAGAAMVFKLKTNLRFRGGHPRFYLTGIGANNLTTPETWLATGASTFLAAFQAMITAIQTAPPAAVGVVVNIAVSYFQGFHNVTFPSGRVRSVATLRTTPVQLTIASYAVNPNVASQRRRNQQSA